MIINIYIDSGKGFSDTPLKVDTLLLVAQRKTLLSLIRRKYNKRGITKSSLEGLVHLCDALIG